jgi:hypothetical protein
MINYEAAMKPRPINMFGEVPSAEPGPILTKRELFAAFAMAGLLANSGPDEWIASDARNQADLLLEDLEKTK